MNPLRRCYFAAEPEFLDGATFSDVGQEKRRRRKQQIRSVWIRNWVTRRPEQGLYERLMVERRSKDPRSFQNFMKMPPDKIDELVQRLTPESPRRLQTGDLP